MLPPSGEISIKSKSTSSEAYAIRRPSGETAGAVSLVCVAVIGCDASDRVSASQRCWLLPRASVNATITCRLSGSQSNGWTMFDEPSADNTLRGASEPFGNT